MANVLKLGIAGRGFMGGVHRAAAGRLENVQIAEAFDWRELIADLQVDALDICLPTDLHTGVAIEALRAGKHVFCEKPMALAVEDCERMMTAAHAHDRVLIIGHVLRFWPEYLRLKQFVDEHRGDVRDALFTRRSEVPAWGKWLQEERRSGGAILDLMIHDIDQALLLFGKPRWVSAQSAGPVDTIEGLLEYSDSLTIRIQGGWYPEGTAFHMGFTISAGDQTLSMTPSGDDAYRAELEYFMECVRTKSPPERCPPEGAAEAVRLALLLKDSRAQNGKRLACVL